jgi:hypothetical protein
MPLHVKTNRRYFDNAGMTAAKLVKQAPPSICERRNGDGGLVDELYSARSRCAL